MSDGAFEEMGQDPQDHVPVDHLIDHSLSDDEILLAARLDEVQARKRMNQPPPPRPDERPYGASGHAHGRSANAHWTAAGNVHQSHAPSERQLFRDPNSRLGGVASGLAYWSGIDVRLMRLLFVLAFLASGTLASVGYIAACILIPRAAPSSSMAYRRQSHHLTSSQGALLLVAFGLALLLGFTRLSMFMIPLIFVGLGVWLFTRDKAEQIGEMPYPFTDDADPLSTTPEYEYYIANRAKRLEQQRTRRNRGIALASAIAGLMVIGTLAATLNSPGQNEEVDMQAISLDESGAVDGAPLDPEVPVEEGLPAQQSEISGSFLQTRPATISSLSSVYSVNDGTLDLDLTNTQFDQDQTIVIEAQDSSIAITVPDNANLQLSTALFDSSFEETGIDAVPPPEDAATLTIEIQGTNASVVVQRVEG